MAQESLEEQYNNFMKWSPRSKLMDDPIAESLRIYEQLSSEARAVLDYDSVAYGTTEREKMDIYGLHSLPKDAPILVFIHGGYWQIAVVTKENSSFMAVPVVESGTVLVVVDYNNAPDVDMDTIVQETKKATKYIFEFAEKRGSRGIYLSGASAGGHLSAMLLAVDWTKEVGEAAKRLKGWIGFSGVYNPTPLIETALNDALKLTKESASRNDCMNYVSDICRLNRHVDCLVTIGEHESPAFHEQSEEFYKALTKGGMKTKYMVIPDRDHLTLVECLQNEEDILLKEIIQMIN